MDYLPLGSTAVRKRCLVGLAVVLVSIALSVRASPGVAVDAVEATPKTAAGRPLYLAPLPVGEYVGSAKSLVQIELQKTRWRVLTEGTDFLRVGFDNKHYNIVVMLRFVNDKIVFSPHEFQRLNCERNCERDFRRYWTWTNNLRRYIATSLHRKALDHARLPGPF